MATVKPIQCRPCFQKTQDQPNLAALAQVIAGKDNPAILGGNPSVEGMSIFSAEPVEIFQFSLADKNPFEKLSSCLSKYALPLTLQQDLRQGIFCGGWIGYFGYELGRFIEKLPTTAVKDLGFPVIRLAFYDKAILYDHAIKQYELLALDWDGSSTEAKFESLHNWLRQAQSCQIPPLPVGDSVRTDLTAANITQQQYFEALEKTKQYIIDGDVYQINFSQRFESDFNNAAVDLFHWQNQNNPSPYGAFLSWDDKAVVSASPELFLRVSGDHICTKPIKGTRPRNPLAADGDPENRAGFNELVRSEKDQAELAMIVDLERNDLAKICVPGTRRVTCGRAIEAFPTVYHAVGVVEGTLALPSSPCRIIEILKAVFPGGSITGAPKIRAMEIIDELEPTARSVYTGSIGWIGLNFDLCWNIAIRTILIENSKAYVQTGGGIVADSNSRAEWEETLTKAAALLKGLAVVR
ncbi:MAG: anthranilate synthase component I family protein [Planctomycetota bacterium]|jgi:para-aminobenzoate synthetase component 1